MSAYYNEIDPYAAQWLRNLIAAGHIPAGDVDERSIEEVSPDDVTGYRQAHFFAGIGGWGLAARLAGLDDGAEFWTGSCPCQPFSSAGKRGGESDERHLWPEFCRLIRERRPSIIFGEQVSGKAGLGWLDGVFDDLEDGHYACAAADLPAASVGAPHVRQRIFWVAHDPGQRVAGPIAPGSASEMRPWRTCGPEDLHAIRDRPYVAGARIPQPLLRSVDDGFPAGVAGLHSYGNAIVPQAAAEFMVAALQCIP